MMKRAPRLLLVLLVSLSALFGYRALRRTPPEALLGLWVERDGRNASDELRFYYFHKGGKGLYRYGQIAHNQTHSFDWQLDGDRLELRFRKTGEHAVTRFVLGDDGGQRTLVLVEDPRGYGRVRYRLRPSSLEVEGPLAIDETAPAASVAEGTSSAIAGRMWIDLQHYATGGLGFVMYQLSEHAVAPGWQLGWHHRGDFDDWTTETLLYKLEPGALRLRFVLRGDELVSPTALGQAGAARTLTLGRDPRNFLARTRLVDAGASF